MLLGEWRLDYPGTSFSIGGWDPVANPFRLPNAIGLNAAPTVADVELTLDDAALPRSDGATMGRDYRGGRTITFSISCRGSSEAEALQLAARVATAWRGDSVRQQPGAYAQLSTYNGGRERAVFGRPRRYAANDADRKAGLILIECDFQTLDDRFYDLVDTGISVDFVNPDPAGVVTPVRTPVTTTPAGTVTPSSIRVDGDLQADPIVTLVGPITNPSVTVLGAWSLALEGSIGDGVRVTADTRPWVRSVTDQSGGSYAGSLTRASRLDRMRLSPGNYGVTMSGIDNTGRASMQIAWRNAYASL